jgi:NTP pyrophosphatase (non-canonical NTP hydrolase)
MNFDTYKPLALRTEKPLASALLRLEHAQLGFITEIGEFTTDVKRTAIYEKPIDEKMFAHMREELGDILWYAAIAADAIDLAIPEYEFVFQNEFLHLDLRTQLKTIALRMGIEVGFIGTDIPFYDRKNARDFMARGIVNVVSLVAHACDCLGFKIEELMIENIDKLAKRYPEKFTNAAAESRADKGGVDAHNS